MREVKFRGWSILADAWVFGSLVDEYRIVGKVVEWTDEYFNTEWWYNVDPDSVGQYTGLKDKNGQEIYEGDIVEVPYFSNVNPSDRDDEDYIDDKPRVHIICYDSRQAMFKSVPVNTYKINAGNGGWTGYRIECHKVSVIGNIYENPELLEGR